MKRVLILSLSLGMFLLVGVSAAEAQFKVGERVMTTDNLNVRSSPVVSSSTFLGVQPRGAYGTVAKASLLTTSYNWTNVNFDTGPDGWVVSQYLTRASAPTSTFSFSITGGGQTSTSTVCGDLNGDGILNVQDVNLIADYIFRYVPVPPGLNLDLNGDGIVDVLDVVDLVNHVFRGGLAPDCGGVQNQPPSNVEISGPGLMTTSTFGHWGFIARDPEGGNLTYNVSWGDGTSSSTISPSGQWLTLYHLYPGNGNYTITFTATDSGGLSASLTRTVTVNVGMTNQPPVINSFTGPSSVAAGTLNTWLARADDPNGNPLTYAFYWGDGYFPVSSTVFGASGATVSAIRTYWFPGTYTQTLRVWDTPYSGSVQQSRTLTVTSSSTAPTPTSPKTFPTTSLTPASLLQSTQAELSRIYGQLYMILRQLGQ